MSQMDIRIDPSDGEAYTYREMFLWYMRQKWDKEKIDKHWSTMQPFVLEKPELRFSQGDRVLCNMGERRLAGVVLSLNVEDPEDPRELIAYVVKTDNYPGVAPSRTISAPGDVDMVVCRERCFNSVSEKDFTKWAAPLVPDRSKPLRFAVGDAVAIRVKDNDDGYEQWADGNVVDVWYEFPEPMGQGFVRTAAVVPYKVSLQSDPNQTYFCHRDEHTLIRKQENKPRITGKTISKRFERRQLDNGSFEKYDHVTLRSKRGLDCLESDSD